MRSSVYEVRGRRVRVKDSLRTFLSVCRLLADDRLDVFGRMVILLPMVIENPDGFLDAFGDESHEALADIVWDAFSIDLTGERAVDKAEKVIDWDEDKARIVATVRAAYTLSYDEFLDTPFNEARALIGMAPHDTPMGQALYYRTAEPPRRTKHNKEEVERFRKMKEAYRLGKSHADNANDRATSEFDMLERRLGR